VVGCVLHERSADGWRNVRAIFGHEQLSIYGLHHFKAALTLIAD
jgi:hypothetical protein